MQTPSLFGGDLSTTPDSRESTVPCSETKARSYHRSLSDRLTPSLISAGLVKGITPMSIRQLSGQPIRVLAFDMPDGVDVVAQKAAYSSSKNPIRKEQTND
jgi:hypothetical protein